MYLHREGFRIIFWTSLIILVLSFVLFAMIAFALALVFVIGLVLVWLWTVAFFRVPKRHLCQDSDKLISPADGRVVAIEKVFEPEVLKTECTQISVFMSPFNVHINRYPVSGRVVYSMHHHGKYLVAWHPKSSELNERSSVCIEQADGSRILMRQIAGAMARRIVCYAKSGDFAQTSGEMGFIKFGSRVDVFVPTNYPIQVSIGEKVRGGVSILALISA